MTGAAGQGTNECPHLWHAFDLTDLDDISIDQIRHVVPEEIRPPCGRSTNGFGEPATKDCLDVVVAGHARPIAART